MSWGVRRIEEEPLGQPQGGQRRPAMTVGEWLETVSGPDRRHAQPQTQSQAPSQTSGPSPTEILDRKLDDLNRRLKQLAEASKGDSQDRNGRDKNRSRRRQTRDQAADSDRDRGRSDMRDPLRERLDQIDKRLQAIAEGGPRTASAYESDHERLKRGMRDIERLQADTLGESRASRYADLDDGHTYRGTRERHPSPVAQMINKLEEEVRGLRQSVEKRLETVEPSFDERDLQDMRRMLERLTESGASRQESDYVRRLLDEMARLREVVLETSAKVAGPQQARANQESRLADMVERLAAVATAAQEKTSDDMRSLDRRLADVADRMADLEGRGASQKDLVDIQRAIDAIALRLDHPPAAPKPVIPASLLDLDIRIEKLGEKLDRIEPNPATQRQMASLESEIAALRFDFAQSPATRTPDRFDEQLNSLGERIDRLASLSRGTERLADEMSAMNERVERLAARPDPSARLSDQMATIGDRIDQLATKSASGDRIEQQIKAMSERIERMSAIAQTNIIGPSRLESFEARIGEIVTLLNQSSKPHEALGNNISSLHGEVTSLRRDIASIRPAERNPELEDLLRSLSQRLETAARERPDPRLLASIEERIARLDQVLAEQRKPLDTGPLEAKLGKIEVLLTENRSDVVEAANAAVRDAVKEFAAIAAESRASDADLKTIESELRQVQTANRTTESRTSDALQSVHDALTTIVGRLGAIERAARETAIERPAAEPISTAASRMAGPQDAPTQVVRPQAPQAETRPVHPQAGPAAPQAAMPQPPTPQQPHREAPTAIVPPPPEDTRPLEPGSGKPGRGGGSAGSDVAGNKRGDFIAAARRAALAASQTGPGVPPPVQPDAQRPGVPLAAAAEPQPKSKSLFKSLFRGKQKALILAGVGIAALATATPLVMTRMIQTASIDQPAPARVATASGTPVAPTAADPKGTQVAVNAEALALAPPSGTTTTFAQPPKAEDATRQAALTAALKQAAAAQGIKSQTEDDKALTTGSVHAPSGGDASRQQMPTAVGTSVPDEAKPAAAAKFPMPAEKVGSLALREAAASGDPRAEFEVGMRYSEGKVVPTDAHEATVWFERAAQQHLAPAAYRLGSAYEKGLGVDRNATEAKRWYREAAEAGNVRSMHNLGVLYANDRDMPSAIPWFHKAAEAGLKDSQFNLGIIYAIGSGVKQDLAVSYKWFALAALQGDQEAGKKRDEIATHLDHTALASAKMAVSTWRPAPISREANEESAVWSEPATAAGPAVAPRAALPTGAANKVSMAQAALQAKGLYAGKIDGEMSSETRAAIRAFQKKSGLKQTGDIDLSFLNAINGRPM
jgi:localization factor PodJL